MTGPKVYLRGEEMSVTLEEDPADDTVLSVKAGGGDLCVSQGAPLRVVGSKYGGSGVPKVGIVVSKGDDIEEVLDTVAEKIAEALRGAPGLERESRKDIDKSVKAGILYRPDKSDFGILYASSAGSCYYEDRGIPKIIPRADVFAAAQNCELKCNVVVRVSAVKRIKSKYPKSNPCGLFVNFDLKIGRVCELGGLRYDVPWE